MAARLHSLRARKTPLDTWSAPAPLPPLAGQGLSPPLQPQNCPSFLIPLPTLQDGRQLSFAACSPGSFTLWTPHNHFSLRHLVVKPTRRLLTSGSGQLAILLAASGALGGREWSVCVLSTAGGRSRAKAEQSTQALP